MVKNIASIILVVFFTILAGVALLHSGLPPTHDGEYHVIRFYEFDRVLRDGNWYPRWAPDLNYGIGVPLFNYVYPWPNYMASFLHLFGFSFIDLFKLNMFLAIIVGGVFFYLWTKNYWGKMGGIVSSIFYTFSPYHFLDIYIRGSVGEVWALAFFPAFLWSITIFIKEKRKKYGYFSAIFLSFIIFSHNILALMFLTFSVFYILFLIYKSKEKKFFMLNATYLILLGLGLSAIFWLPALLETKFVTGLQIYNIQENFPEIYQLLIPSWGSGFSGEASENQMSFQIGIANLLSIVLSLIALFFIKNNNILANNIKEQKSKIKNSKSEMLNQVFDREAQTELVQHDEKRTILFFLIWFFIVFLLMLKVSLPIWNVVPLLNYFQFPWRLLSIEILITSFLVGSFIYFLKSSLKKTFISIFMVLIAVLFSLNYAKPAYYHDRTDSHYLTRENFMYGTNSPGDFFNTIWAKRINKLKKEKVIDNEDIKVLSETIKTTNYSFNINANKDSQVTINTAYFPGWEARIDGRKTKVNYDKDGLMILLIPKGNHYVNLKLEDTFVGKIAKIMSIASFIFILVLFTKDHYAKIKR